jgi:hypothetical protein
MYAKKTDKNQQTIINAFRGLGATVYDLSKVGNGIPDLLIGYKNHTCLVEVKSSEKATYTKHQKEFLTTWKGGMVLRIDSIDGAIRLIKLLNSLQTPKTDK